jgi:hypothetical protein
MTEHDHASPEQAAPAGRPPAGFVETALANCRPQPAIPALLTLFLTVLIAVFTYVPEMPRSLLGLLIPLGILASCGLAIAAGFCSFFPPASWILVAAWALKFTGSGPLPAYNQYVLYAGIAAAGLMIVVQAWRVASGRFVPTVQVDTEPG